MREIIQPEVSNDNHNIESVANSSSLLLTATHILALVLLPTSHQGRMVEKIYITLLEYVTIENKTFINDERLETQLAIHYVELSCLLP
jgi:hypothetical protein